MLAGILAVFQHTNPTNVHTYVPTVLRVRESCDKMKTLVIWILGRCIDPNSARDLTEHSARKGILTKQNGKPISFSFTLESIRLSTTDWPQTFPLALDP